MKRILCFTAIFLFLKSCVSPFEFSRATDIPALAPTLTYTPVSTATPSPTVTPTRQPTLPPKEYPKLADFVLQPKDVPPYLAYFRSYFWGPDQSGFPRTEDLTSSLKKEGSCSLDCVRVEWTSGSRYVGISLIRKADAQEAIQASFDLCTSSLQVATSHWTTPLAPTGFEECRSEMSYSAFTPYTWILGFYGVDVYGSVLIIADVSPLGGSDWGVHEDVLHTTLELQIEKLQSMNFPVSE